MITTERLAGHCPVHGSKEIKNMKKTSCKTALEQNVRTAGTVLLSCGHHQHELSDFQNYQTYESQRFMRGGPGQWSYRENSGQTARKFLAENLLPELPEYFKRVNSQSSVSTTKTSHTDLSLKKNINLCFSSAVATAAIQVINNYQHCTDSSLATK